MKKLFALLMIAALLLGLTACFSGGEDNPTTTPDTMPTQTTTTPEPTATAAPIKTAFERALQLYGWFAYESLAGGNQEELIEYNGRPYFRVTREFVSMSELKSALLDVFSVEIAQGFLSRTAAEMYGDLTDPSPEQAAEYEAQREAAKKCPLYIEQDGKLYTCLGDRGADENVTSVSVVNESESKVVQKVTTVNWDGKTNEVLLTQEWVDGKWIFTDFPVEW